MPTQILGYRNFTPLHIARVIMNLILEPLCF